MAKNITFIPAKTNNKTINNLPQKKRMAAYCRVSTEHEEQLTSYTAQVEYYTNYITNHPDYEFVFCYADEGITGTSTKKREQFNKMIEDCKSGKIDMIITKSISRFARNTLDTLNYVRMLKELGIGIIFEKESINTLDSKGEVLLTILSSLAQDESRSISENSLWGVRRRFEQGKILIVHTRFLGYDKDNDGNLIINKEQAKIVRRVFKEFLNIKGTVMIARELEQDGVLNWNGKTKWFGTSINSMLINEKYKGDALLQKTYTVDFLSKTRAVNNGIVPQYYVEDSHEAIIEKEVWNAVQLEFERRKNYMKKYKVTQLFSSNPLTGRIICGHCSRPYKRVTWNSTDEILKRNVWQCSCKYKVKGVVACNNKHVDEYKLHESFVTAFNNKPAGGIINDDLGKIVEKRFRKIFKKKITEFDGDLFLKVVEMIVVLDDVVRICFLDGTFFEV